MSSLNTKQNSSLSPVVLIILQIFVGVYSLSSVFLKITSQQVFFSLQFFVYLGVVLMLLGIYAIAWQQILKRVDLSVAYVNRATAIIWSLLWSVLIFKEHITIQNILGVAVILAGVIIVNLDNQDNKTKEQGDSND